MTDRDQQQAIMQAQARAHADLVNAVNGFRATLIEATRAIQKAAVEPFVDTGGTSGGTFEFKTDTYYNTPDWKSILTLGQKHETPRSPVLCATPGLWYFGDGTIIASRLLGIIARVRWSVGHAAQQEMIIDVPSNGVVTIPLVGGVVTVDVMLAQVAYTVAQLQAVAWTPDQPKPLNPDFTNPGTTAVNPQIITGVTPHAAISRTRYHVPSRSISIKGGSGDGAFELPIPRGTQSLVVTGPADLIATQRDITGNSASVAQNLVGNQETVLLPGARIVEMASAGGGYMSATFYMGS